MRKLKFHEKKLLKKVDFLQWKNENNVREIQVMRRYHVQNREDYGKYNALCGKIKHFINELANLHPTDPFRAKLTDALVHKLYDLGLINQKKLSDCQNITVSSFCRRRLPVVLVRLKFVENVKEGVTFIEQGHIRVGPEVIKDPAYLVSRNLEDFVTWVDTSKIRKKVLKYNDKLDDYDFLA